jgi:transposase
LVLERIKGMATTKKYPVEVQERAVAMVGELERELGAGRGAIAQVAKQLGVHPEAPRYWVRRERGGRGPAASASAAVAVTAEGARIIELEKENRELRRANEILRLASAFFAREMDPRPPR